mgnify:CR=1 FL=1
MLCLPFCGHIADGIAQSLVFHAVCCGFLTGRQLLPAEVGVHHRENGQIIGHVADDDRNFQEPDYRSGVFPSCPEMIS